MSHNDRYDKEHTYGEVKFYLSTCYATEEQSRYLMLKVMDQAIRDYCALVNSTLPSEKLSWETAKAFIYDDDYRIQWGEWELPTKDFLDMIDIDIYWFREQVTKKFNLRHGVQSEQQTKRRIFRRKTK